MAARRGARADLPVQTVFSTNFDMDTPFRVYASVQDHGGFRAPIDISNGRENLKADSVGERARR